MSTDGVGIFTGSAPSSAPGSPKSRLKFLCSHGGRILPRPSDGHLKYVGGETRVISVPIDISFQELMKKVCYKIDGQMRLKYQLRSEDLDALVSVKSDEDLRHMLDEINFHEHSNLPRLRTFLFPLKPPEPNPIRLHAALNAMQQSSRVSSACSSPRSPDSCTTETLNQIPNSYFTNTGQASISSIHRVRSSPTICSLGNGPSICHQPAKLIVEQQKSLMPDRLISVRSVGRAEGVRFQVDSLPVQYYAPFIDRRMMGERNVSLATSPVSASPLGPGLGSRAWDRDV
ncbi:octicosapeptide/Phox/Bem1p family protein [Striga asiatica]|uniref:Octicosapeptide/Phox/Bem1p family protein n=1 Tax=Striga asiatica TaxID=4170 RepID=A0A5A7RC20_STRAF|nr:octicosapeptide/Phox/Bem1p family protein [Striga asiatica]